MNVYKTIAKRLMFVFLAIIVLNSIIFSCLANPIEAKAVKYGEELTQEVKDLLNNSPRNPGTMMFPIYNRQTPGLDVDRESKNSPAGEKAYTAGTRGFFVMNDEDIAIMERFAQKYFTDDMDVATRLWTAWKHIHEDTHYAVNGCPYGWPNCHKAHWSETEGKSYIWAIHEENAGQCNSYNGAMTAWLVYFGFEAYMVKSWTSGQHYWCECIINGERYYFETGNRGKNGDGWQYFCSPAESSSHKYTNANASGKKLIKGEFSWTDDNGKTWTLNDGSNPFEATVEPKTSIIGTQSYTKRDGTQVKPNGSSSSNDGESSSSGDSEGVEGTNKYSDTILRRVYYMLRHPVKALGNLLAGLCQLGHNSIAVGDTGNIFNISWLLSWDLFKTIIVPYMIVTTVIVVIALLYRYLSHMIKVGDNVFSLIRDTSIYFVATMIPVIILTLVGNCFDGLTKVISRDMTGKIALMEASYKEYDFTVEDLFVENSDGTVDTSKKTNVIDKIKDAWNLLDDESIGQYIFRESFIDSDNGKSYEFSTIKMPVAYDAANKKMIYKNITLKELYNSVSYQEFVNSMIAERRVSQDNTEDVVLGHYEENETNAEDSTDDAQSTESVSEELSEQNVSYKTFDTLTGLDDSAIKHIVYDDTAPKYLYYSYDRFVPVHYDKYNESVFYYFYDWIKYQYLSYWSQMQEGSKNFTKAFVLPGIEVDTDALGIDFKKVTVTENTYTETVTSTETVTTPGDTTPSGTGKLAGLRIGIDPGHQRYQDSSKEPNAPWDGTLKQKVSSGCAGYKTNTPEYEFTLDMSLQMKKTFEAEGAVVAMVRTDNAPEFKMSNKERAELMDAENVDIWIRVHADGSDNHSLQGLGIYCLEVPAKYRSDPKYADYAKQAELSQKYGKIVLPIVIAETGAKNFKNGIVTASNYTGQNWSKSPVFMIECGFFSNAEEEAKLLTESYRQKIADGLAKGLAECFKDKVGTTPSTQPTTETKTTTTNKTVTDITWDVEEMPEDPWEAYKFRIEVLEQMYLSQATTGMYQMYDDMNYAHSNTKEYYNDLFGLSYLFKMTDGDYMVDELYKQTNSIELWANANRANYLNGLIDYNDYVEYVQDETTTDFPFTDVNPISSVISGKLWNYYKDSRYLINPYGKRNTMTRYAFTPDTIADSLDQELDVYDGTGRIPGRLYASSVLLDQIYANDKVKALTLENKLCKLNEQIYKDVVKVTSYMPGQVTDDTLIFVAALMATTRFNEMFDSFNKDIYPMGIEHTDLDMDKIMRLTYTNEIYRNDTLDTMYMIYDSNGGFFIMFVVLLSEVLLIIASATRALLLIMFFIGICLLTFNYFRGNMPQSSPLLSGVGYQLASLVLMHTLIVGSVMLVFNLVSNEDSTAIRVGVTLLGLFLYFIVVVVNTAMLMVFIQDIKHFGGAVLNNAIATIKAQVDLAMSDDKDKPDMDIDSADLNLTEEEIAQMRRDANLNKLRRNADDSGPDTRHKVAYSLLCSKGAVMSRNSSFDDEASMYSICSALPDVVYCAGKFQKAPANKSTVNSSIKNSYNTMYDDNFMLELNQYHRESNDTYDYFIPTVIVKDKSKPLRYINPSNTTEIKTVTASQMARQGITVMDASDIKTACNNKVYHNGSFVNPDSLDNSVDFSQVKNRGAIVNSIHNVYNSTK